jgi:hypothetical protein
MRSTDSIINKFAVLACVVFLATISATAQRIAVLTPDKNRQEIAFAAKLAEALVTRYRALDNDMADAAFKSVSVNDPYNLTTEAAKNIGSVIGCDYFILVRSNTLRRVSLNRPDYFESFAAAYVVSARTGWLVIWKLQKTEAETESKAEEKLLASTNILASEIFKELPGLVIDEAPPRAIEEVPAENTPAAKNFRAPVPYLRIAPEKTPLAFLYDIKATVDIQVDLDADGKILRTEIVRWAGFGLDGSVDAAVRKMNWRPAERNGKTLPIRFLLRYNFKKIEKE